MHRLLQLSFAILATLMFAQPVAADTIYLAADFNDKTLGAPIGTGGPEVGEPIQVDPYITAIVADSPMASPSLQISDNSDFTAGAVCFEFLDGVELTTGTVVVAADLWFHEISPGYGFSLKIRENSGASMSFTDVNFDEYGDVWCYDEGGTHGVVGTYEVGQIYRVIIDYNMDAGTYDLYLNGLRVLDDEPHGVVGGGVGGVYFGTTSDGDVNGVFNVDAITVTDYYQATNTLVTTWGSIKSSYR